MGGKPKFNPIIHPRTKLFFNETFIYSLKNSIMELEKMTEQTIGILEASQPVELSPARFKDLAETILRHQTDEELAPLSESITDRLRNEGLNQAYDDLGISRFLGFSQKERANIKSGWGFAKRDGGFDLFIHTHRTHRAKEKLRGTYGRSPIEAEDTSYRGKKYVLITTPPVRVGKQIASYLKGTPHRQSFFLGTIRIHECAHFCNSEKTNAPLRKSHGRTVIGDIFREQHSEMVYQVLNYYYPEENAIGIFGQSLKDIERELVRQYGPETAQEFIKKHLTHRESIAHPESENMARYATGVIWRLRALGFSEREISENIAMFQRKSMLDWDSKEQNCTPVEKWIEAQMTSQSLSKDDIGRKILETKERIEANNKRVQEIMVEEATDYLANLDYKDVRIQTEDSIIITGQLPIGGVCLSKGAFWEAKLQPGFQLEVETINFQKMQVEPYQPDGSSARAWAKSLLDDSLTPAEEKISRHLKQADSPKTTTPLQREIMGEAVKLLEERQEAIQDDFRRRKIAEALGNLKTFREAFVKGGEQEK